MYGDYILNTYKIAIYYLNVILNCLYQYIFFIYINIHIYIYIYYDIKIVYTSR